MSIRSRLFLSLAGLAALTAVIGVLTRKTNQLVEQELDRLTGESLVELAAAGDLVELSQNAQISMDIYIGTLIGKIRKGYGLNDKTVRAEVQESLRESIEKNLETVRDILRQKRRAAEANMAVATVSGDHAARERESGKLDDFISPLETEMSKHQEMFEKCFELSQSDKYRAAAFLQNEVAPHFEDEILPLLTRYSQAAREEVEERTGLASAHLVAAERRILYITFGAGALAIALGLLLAGLIANPLENLQSVVERFGKGDHEVRSEIERRDEIGGLALAFNRMADNLQESKKKLIEEAEHRHDAEQKAHVRLQKLAHLNRLGAMGEMAAGLAHELNQPLGAVTTYSQASIRLLENDDGGAAAEAMKKAAEQARRAGEIVHSLREFVINATPTLQACPTDSLISLVTNLVESEARKMNVGLETVCEPGLPPVTVDRVQIQQVLLNLIRNAIEATAQSGVEDGLVRITASTTHDGRVLVGVCDNGGGPDTPDLEQIFDPFVSSKESGMGMGLAISRSIIEAHNGGKLWATANETSGLTFYFTLTPAGEAPADLDRSARRI